MKYRIMISAALLAAVVGAQEKVDPLADRLQAMQTHLAKIKAPAASLKLARQALADRDVEGMDLALAQAFPAYAKTLEGLADGDLKALPALATLAEGAKDPYVRLHAQYRLGRFLLESEDPEGASKALHGFFAGKSQLSPFEPQASFFLGTALSRIPSREEAIGVLKTFLKAFPWAPERYRAVAFQVLEELKRPDDNPLHGVADEMKSVERKLGKGNPGKKTVDQEKKILDKLDKLIEEMEKNEKKKKGNKGGSGKQSSNPMQSSQTAKGKPKINPLTKAARKIAARWATLPKKEREKVLQDLKKRFPPRYRELLEAYFKKLSRRR